MPSTLSSTSYVKRCIYGCYQGFSQDAHIADSFLPEGGLSEQFFLNCFQEAVSIAEKRNVMLYCGEYGVISYIDPGIRKHG